MKKPVKSVNSRLMVLLILVIGLAVAVLTIGRGQDTRSSAAGSCPATYSVTTRMGCTSNKPPCAQRYTTQTVGCSYSSVYGRCRTTSVIDHGQVDCNTTTCKSGPEYGYIGTINCGSIGGGTCGGTRGSCSGSCPKGQVCQAPNVKSNGDKCGCHPAPKPTKKK